MIFDYPVYRPHFSGLEKEFVTDCLNSTWISSKGKYISEFERRFATFLNVKRAIAVCNGTVALHVALTALGIGAGDEVLVPTLTYIASANAVTYTGAKAIFVDSEPDYWQMDVDDAERKITERTKAIMPVHLYGHPCEMDAVMELARKYSISVVEDCAEAIGTRYSNRHVGTFGDIACFSFYGNKTITTGEGGMVVSNNNESADLVSRLKGQGLAINAEYYHDLIGYNYRMTNVCAAIGCAQMEIIDEIVSKKQMIAEWYREFLEGAPVQVHRARRGVIHSYWMVTILSDTAEHRDPLRAHLREKGVETRPVFFPINTMDIYKCPGNFPVAKSISARGINMPSYPDLTRIDVASICEFVKEYFAARGNR